MYHIYHERMHIFWHPPSASLPSKFQDLEFPGPNSFSRPFQVLEVLQTEFQDFPGGVGTPQVRFN